MDAQKKATAGMEQAKKDAKALKEQNRHLTEERRRLQGVVGTLNTVEAERKQLEADLAASRAELRKAAKEAGAGELKQLQALTRQMDEALAAERVRCVARAWDACIPFVTRPVCNVMVP